jgi:hypothetical protein
MATIRIDNMDFADVPETVAVLMNQKLNQLVDLQSRKDALEIQLQEHSEQFDELNEQIDELTDERDRERGRADALEIQLATAASETHQDAAPATYKGKKKGKAMVEEMDEDEEDDPDDIDEVGEVDAEDDEDMEPEPLPKKGRKKGIKKDSVVPTVDPKVLFAALTDANALIPGLITEDKFDSIETPTDVRRLVVASLNPNLDLTGRSDAYIDGVYDYLKAQGVEQDATPRNDSMGASYVGSHTPPSELSTAIAQSRATSTFTSPLQGAAQKQTELYMNSWKKPLDLV